MKKFLLELLMPLVILSALLAIGVSTGSCSEEEPVSRFDSLSPEDQAEVRHGCDNPTFRITSCDIAYNKSRCMQTRYDACLERYVPWR